MGSEREWIEQARHGDADSQRALYDAHVDRIFRLAYRMSGDAMLAEDWTQEAFVRAFDRIAQYRGDHGEVSFGGWLRAVAVSVILNGMKRTKRDRERVVSVADLDREARSRPEDLALRRKLYRAIDELPETLRPTFVMHELEGFPLQEIADAFEVPIGTIKARVSRAREKLREALSDALAPEREMR